jgi:predicted TIM-barrel fold metal-dependent hydrolase
VARKPDSRLPPKTCDAHCHVFGPAAKFPFAPNRAYTPEDAPKEGLAALHRHLVIERAVIVQASCHGTDNTAMLDAIATSGGAYRGVAIVDGSFGDRQYRALHEGGVRGVRFNFVKHLGGAPDLALMRRILDRIAGHGWHVVLHLDASGLIEFDEVIRAIRIPFVIDHMGRVKTGEGTGQAAFRALLALLDLDRCWVKVSGAERISSGGPPFRDAIPFAQALIEKAPDRVLWGTDWPHPNVGKHRPDEADLVDLLPLFAADDRVRRKLLVDNPARLYGWDA